MMLVEMFLKIFFRNHIYLDVFENFLLYSTLFKLYRAISSVCMLLKTATDPGDSKMHTNNSCLC